MRSAVGYDKSRGDSVEVVNLRFASAPSRIPLDQQEAGLFDFTKRDLFYFAELGVIVLLSLLTLLFIVRPLVRKIVTPEEPQEAIVAAGERQVTYDAEGNPVALPAPERRRKPPKTGYRSPRLKANCTPAPSTESAI